MTMRICLAAAVGLVGVTGAAFAQVSIYGVVDSYAERLRNGSNGSVTRVSSGGLSPSRLGFKGTEDLGQGLSANFVLESGFTVDVGNLLQGGRMFGREAYVSLASKTAGVVRFGRQYAPIHYSIVGSDIDGYSTFSTVLPIYLSNGDQSRQDNQLSYWTPDFSGVSAGVSASAGEATAVAPGAATPWVPVAGTIRRNFGGLLRYADDAWRASVALHQGGQTVAAGTVEQRSMNLGLSYRTAGWQVAGGYWTHRNELANGASAKTKALSVGARLQVSPSATVTAQTTRVQDDGHVYTTGASKATGKTTYYNVGANYAFSKRTDVYVRYFRATDSSGGYNARNTTALFGIFGPGNVMANNTSANTLGVGLRHWF